MSLSDLCSGCTACGFAKEEKQLFYAKDPTSYSQVLLIDDLLGMEWSDSHWKMNEIIPVDWTRTFSIRCEKKGMTKEEVAEGTAKCSVWTHLMVKGYKLILTTQRGAEQLSLADVKVGSIYKAEHLGVVLIIPPLANIQESEFKEYRMKIRRCLKSIGALD